jgi:hypothetical protein
MAKLSPRFVTYFIFASLALAFIFPITHSAYEGLKNKENDDEENEEDEESEVKEGFDGSTIISDLNAMLAKLGGGKK